MHFSVGKKDDVPSRDRCGSRERSTVLPFDIDSIGSSLETPSLPARDALGGSSEAVQLSLSKISKISKFQFHMFRFMKISKKNRLPSSQVASFCSDVLGHDYKSLLLQIRAKFDAKFFHSEMDSQEFGAEVWRLT